VDYSDATGVVEKLELEMALKKFVYFNASIRALSPPVNPAVLSVSVKLELPALNPRS
jgi:hypothetical protein